MNPSKAATPKTAIAAPRWVIQGLTFGVWLVVFGVAPLPGGVFIGFIGAACYRGHRRP